MSTIKRFEDLEVWQIARELCKFVLRITMNEKFSKDFKFRDQIKAAAGSTMDNIAEGFGRGGVIEFTQFLGISNGSANEVKSQFYRALDWDYISQLEFKEGILLTDKLINKIGSFISYLNSSKIRGQKFKNRN